MGALCAVFGGELRFRGGWGVDGRPPWLARAPGVTERFPVGTLAGGESLRFGPASFPGSGKMAVGVAAAGPSSDFAACGSGESGIVEFRLEKEGVFHRGQELCRSCPFPPDAVQFRTQPAYAMGEDGVGV